MLLSSISAVDRRIHQVTEQNEKSTKRNTKNVRITHECNSFQFISRSKIQTSMITITYKIAGSYHALIARKNYVWFSIRKY